MVVNGIKEEIKDTYGPQIPVLSTTFDSIDPFSFLKNPLFWLQLPAPYTADNHNSSSLSPPGL